MSNPTAENVVQLHPQKPEQLEKQSAAKWGKEAMAVRGFCILPSVLLQAQRRLGINPVQLNILLHLADHWWVAQRMPFPSKTTIAERMNMSARQIQRQIASLEAAGLVKRNERSGEKYGRGPNEYDLSGLVARLKEIAEEFREVDEKAKLEKAAVAKPGFKRRAKKET